VALRQRGGRTLTRIFLRGAEGVNFPPERAAPGSIVSVDGVAHWDLLQPAFETWRINHSEAHSRDGAHTNHTGSYFSRLRRMINGQHYRVGARHLDAYAVHAV